MQHPIDPSPWSGTWCPVSRKLGLCLLGFSLLTASTVDMAFLDSLLPKSPKRPQGLPGRLVRHIQRGELQADLHTLVSLFEYVLTPENEFTNSAGATNVPVAGPPVASPPAC